MIRVVLLDQEYAHIVIPAWNPHEIITIPRKETPQPIQAGGRFFVEANIGAHRAEDLKFKNWEI